MNAAWQCVGSDNEVPCSQEPTHHVLGSGLEYVSDWTLCERHAELLRAAIGGRVVLLERTAADAE